MGLGMRKSEGAIYSHQAWHRVSASLVGTVVQIKIPATVDRDSSF